MLENTAQALGPYRFAPKANLGNPDIVYISVDRWQVDHHDVSPLGLPIIIKDRFHEDTERSVEEIFHDYIQRATGDKKNSVLQRLDGNYHTGLLEGYSKQFNFNLVDLTEGKISINPVQLLIFPSDQTYQDVY